MTSKKQQLETLNDIKQIMERSSRFISLSGISGVVAGVCALVGAALAYNVIGTSDVNVAKVYNISTSSNVTLRDFMGGKLMHIAIWTFIAAFVTAFLFTYIKSKKQSIPLWGTATKRLLINVVIFMGAGSVFLWKLIEAGVNGYIAPGCLIIYGFTLINASKHTLSEIKYLGLIITILGVINLFFIGYGLYFWAAGFGVMHIIYGAAMWWKYERKEDAA